MKPKEASTKKGRKKSNGYKNQQKRKQGIKKEAKNKGRNKNRGVSLHTITTHVTKTLPKTPLAPLRGGLLSEGPC